MAHATTLTMPAPTSEAALARALRSFALLRESWVGMTGAGIILFWVAVALLAHWIAPFGPNATLVPWQKPLAAFAGNSVVPPGRFWLGTDHLGRDILSRIIWGSRTVLTYAPLATLCAYTVGSIMGLAAGYLRG